MAENRKQSVNESAEQLVIGAPSEGGSTSAKGFPKGVTRVIIASTVAEAMGTRPDESTPDMPFVSLVYNHIAEFYGMKASPMLSGFDVPVTGTDAPKDGKLTVRLYGSKGAKSIKVPMMKTADTFEETENGNRRHMSIPVPGWAGLEQIFHFLKDVVTKNHPTYFISPHGRTHPIKLT